MSGSDVGVLSDLLISLHEKVDAANEKFSTHLVEDEKRFGRIEKLIGIVAAIQFLPKLADAVNGSSLVHVLATGSAWFPHLVHLPL